MTHALKTWPDFYKDVETCAKNFEIRLNDRDFKVGDTVLLQEFDPKTSAYTRKELTRSISYVMEGGKFGLHSGYVVLGLKVIDEF